MPYIQYSSVLLAGCGFQGVPFCRSCSFINFSSNIYDFTCISKTDHLPLIHILKLKTMKTKKYLKVLVNRNDGTWFSNPLKLSEAHLVSQIAQENKSLTVQLIETSNEGYKAIFG